MEFILKPKPPVTGNEALHLEDAFHGYFDPAIGRVRTVLNDIDLIVSRGEFVSLVGTFGLRQIHHAQAFHRPGNRPESQAL